MAGYEYRAFVDWHDPNDPIKYHIGPRVDAARRGAPPQPALEDAERALCAEGGRRTARGRGFIGGGLREEARRARERAASPRAL